MMDTTDASRQQILTRLESLLKEVCDDCQTGPAVDADAPLSSLGVDSLTLMLLLDRAAKEFDVEWGSDTPAEAVGSLAAIADFVARG
jgi:clorobiocin biosynthesis protein CloN1